MSERIGVIGAGYVGLTTGVCLAALGNEVVVRDIDPGKIAALDEGRIPIYEPGLTALMRDHRTQLEFTMSLERLLAETELVFVAVDTPPTRSGDADLSRVMGVLEELQGGGAGRRHVLIMKSTVPVGTGQRLRVELDTRRMQEVGYVSNPEFLREGTAIADFMHPERVVIGDFDRAHGDRLAAVYAPLGAPIIRTNVPSAEMVKYASNAFLATKISFINEIANVCDEVGVDVAVVAEAMGLDQRIGPSFLRPGIGYGGSCFPKDIAALKQLAGNSGYHFQLLTAVIEVNELQKRRVVSKLKRHLGDLAGKRIALLGLTFKPDTDDLREASSLVLIDRLVAEGARVVAYDPVIEEGGDELRGVEVSSSVEEAVRGADAAVLVTEWRTIVGADWESLRDSMRLPIVIDGRNALDPLRLRAAGFVYEGIGRAGITGGSPAAS